MTLSRTVVRRVGVLLMPLAAGAALLTAGCGGHPTYYAPPAPVVVHHYSTGYAAAPATPQHRLRRSTGYAAAPATPPRPRSSTSTTPARATVQRSPLWYTTTVRATAQRRP